MIEEINTAGMVNGDKVRAYMDSAIKNERIAKEASEKIKKLEEHIRFGNSIIHNMVVANQSAWIEWQQGKGAEEAMVWVHNGLIGPGHIPSNETEATADEWFGKNMVEYQEKQPTH